MANVIFLWSDSLLRIKLSVTKLLQKLPQRILGDFLMIMIIYFYSYHFAHSFLDYEELLLILAIFIRSIQTCARKSPAFLVYNTYSECCQPRLICFVIQGTSYPSRRIIRQTDNSSKYKSEDEF